MEQCIDRLNRFIEKKGYTYKCQDVIKSYVKYYRKGYYCSHTMRNSIEQNINDIKFLYKYLNKRGRI